MKLDKLFDLSGRVAIVTGGGDGIGKAACQILAAAGASVMVSDLKLDKAQSTVDEITANDDIADYIECNVLNDRNLTTLVEETVKRFGTVNILVNNAGMGGGGRENPFNIDREYFERVYSINVVAPWRLCQLCAPYMQESGYGSIVNVTSMASVDTEANMGVYASSKAALNHLAKNLAYDFGPMGIRINSVGPGATRTAALRSILTPELEEKMLRHTPIKRLGEVWDVAAAILYFASPASEWVSGQVLFVNGGGQQTLD